MKVADFKRGAQIGLPDVGPIKIFFVRWKDYLAIMRNDRGKTFVTSLES